MRRCFKPCRILIIAELRLVPDNRRPGAVWRRCGGTRQFVFGAGDAAGADGAEAAAAGEAPGDGDGAAGLGSGALDCVNTIDVIVRSGVAFCCTSVGAVRRKPKLRVSPGTKGSIGRKKLVNSSGVAIGV